MGIALLKTAGTWSLFVIVPLVALFLAFFLAPNWMDKHGYVVLFILPLYLPLPAYMMVYLPERFMVIAPVISQATAQSDIVAKINGTFSGPPFSVASSGDNLRLTWAQGIKYNQIIDVGADEEKRVFLMRFDESTHTAYLTQRSVSWGWNGSFWGLVGSLNFFQGIMFEADFVGKPTFTVSPDGKVSLDLATIKYQSEDILRPLQTIIKQNGWTLRYSMFQTLWARYLFVSLFFILGILPLVGIYRWTKTHQPVDPPSVEVIE